MKGNVIGQELRAIALGNLDDYSGRYGLMCFSPMINIIRDPFWCGKDTFLEPFINAEGDPFTKTGSGQIL